jgi:hypothetical protein
MAAMNAAALENQRAASAQNARGPQSLVKSGTDSLPQVAGAHKQCGHDWRAYYDNARGNVDAAISQAARAWGAGLISDSEYEQIDTALRSQQASLARKPGIPKLIGGPKSRLGLGWPRRRPRRSPNREASRGRARMLGGAGIMPPALRACFTECERAVLYIIAAQIKQHGFCDLSVGEIATRAGVCHRTVQNAVAEAVRQGVLAREERERRGRRNDTKVLRILSQEWLAWIKRGPIGCKEFSASENIDLKKEGGPRFSKIGPRVARILRVSG